MLVGSNERGASRNDNASSDVACNCGWTPPTNVYGASVSKLYYGVHKRSVHQSVAFLILSDLSAALFVVPCPRLVNLKNGRADPMHGCNQRARHDTGRNLVCSGEQTLMFRQKEAGERGLETNI